MKYIIKVLSVVIISAFLFSACGDKPKETAPPISNQNMEENVVEEPTPEETEIKAFFDTYVNTKERPIAVMIDNDNDSARPQAGLDEAYLIYEMVVEGGATRFMALYRGDKVEKIGPVRSSRHYFLDYVMENDAIYTHFGWSPKATTDISAFGIDKINGILSSDESVFWREKKYSGDWHSAYTSIEKILNRANQKKYETETAHSNSITYSDIYIDIEGGEVATDVQLSYSGKYKTSYIYDEENGIYEKYINSQPHVMQSEAVVSVKNIIVLKITDTSLGDGTDRRNVNTTGSGTGYYITNGKCEKITWSKSSRTANTMLKREDGTELLINPGKTIINIISPSAKITFE